MADDLDGLGSGSGRPGGVQMAGDAAPGDLQRPLVAPGAPAAEPLYQLTGLTSDGVVEHQRRQPVGQRPDLLALLPGDLAEPGRGPGRDLAHGVDPRAVTPL